MVEVRFQSLEKLSVQAITRALYLTRLEQRLRAHGGEYFADRRLTVADLKVFVLIVS